MKFEYKKLTPQLYSYNDQIKVNFALKIRIILI